MEFGDCEVVTIGFSTGWTSGTPSLLMKFNPIVTTYDSYLATQKTTFTTQVDGDWLLTYNDGPKEYVTGFETVSTSQDPTSLQSFSYDGSTIPRLTEIQFYQSEFMGYCIGWQLKYGTSGSLID